MDQETDEVDFRIRVTGGYAILEFKRGLTKHEFYAHSTFDALRSLVAALAVAARDLTVGTCRWPDETGGHYVDVAVTPIQTISVAVHEFSNQAATSYRDAFSARRGPLAFEGYFDAQDFLCRAAREYWAIVVAHTDPSGYVKPWGRVFPWWEFEELHRVVRTRYGYRLPSPDEIRDGHA